MIQNKISLESNYLTLECIFIFGSEFTSLYSAWTNAEISQHSLSTCSYGERSMLATRESHLD